ncbi:MAG: Na(+)-translocating NADH-quinone reductase subunit A [Candidatus Azotimanducaceae bacterium]|uniref:Na(+)-translocating NADH-quinone reductase subunit A n=1 Tax=OM182 bacterium TaxID=2510334 RepID=A0A520RZT8_9GAMM|nr:NADH:ubiquinone reductase (Na(+)-transporting) subunit A [Gammaproteobacteria bacterium]RZO75727.1 MAG: Na(+)-translocating NADH-quinone reductase subunit A [OM182 bacterium]
MIRTKRGLDLPIAGSPEQVIDHGTSVRSVALVGHDYPGLKPTMEVVVGDRVKAGQLLFTDKKMPGVKYTSPGCGTVAAINRGARRVFQSIVIDLDGDEAETFPQEALEKLTRESAASTLIESGQWTSLRTRPFSKVPPPSQVPNSIFVTAIDSRPHAPNPELVIAMQPEPFLAGLDVLTLLTDGPLFLCAENGATLPEFDNPKVRREDFSGPHPSGLVGTHIHFLDPVSLDKVVWTIDYQDVIAIGHLFRSGNLFFDRIIALAGPAVSKPRLIRTRIGASAHDVVKGELNSPQENDNRIVSGSVLDGRTCSPGAEYLGRYHNQISVIQEGTNRELLGFVKPGQDKFSLTRLFVSSFLPKRKFAFTTSTGGSERAMVPLGTFEEIMPLDILPTQLLRALLVSDFDVSISLGCLELDEDDIALCTFACPGKYEYGPYLRQMLTTIEAEA